MNYYTGSNKRDLKHWICEEAVSGEEFLVCAETWGEAYNIAEKVGAYFSCGCESEPDVYVNPEPLTEEEAEATGLDEY